MNQQPNAVSTALVEIRNTLMSPEMKHRLAAVLGNRIDPEKFAQVAMVAISKNPDLIKADRASLFTSCMECAADGLLPNGKEAALIAYGQKIQYLPMVRGVYRVVRRTGKYRLFNAHCVYANDQYHEEKGMNPNLVHVPADGPRGEFRKVYAVAVTNEGVGDFESMTRDEVERVRKMAKAPNSPAWVNSWDEMAKKTAVHRLAKRMDLSIEAQRVIDRIEREYDFDNDELAEEPARVTGNAPRAEDFVQAEPEPEPEDYELFDEIGILAGSHTACVWVEQFQAMMQGFGKAKSLKNIEAAWVANESTRERLAGEGMAEYVTEVRTYYERWKAALSGTPVTEARGEKKAPPAHREPKPPSADPEPAAATTGAKDDDTFPGDLPSAQEPDATPEEEPWIAAFRSRLPQVKTEKALDSFTKATFGAPLDALAKANPAMHKELMKLVDAQRKHIRADTPGGK